MYALYILSYTYGYWLNKHQYSIVGGVTYFATKMYWVKKKLLMKTTITENIDSYATCCFLRESASSLSITLRSFSGGAPSPSAAPAAESSGDGNMSSEFSMSTAGVDSQDCT